MALFISTALQDAIGAQALAAGDEECCGLLLGISGWVSAILPAANVSPDPRHRFEIDPATLLYAHREARAGGPAIVGHYHSHPRGNPAPSATDAAMAQGNGEIWLIVDGDGNLAAWRAGSSGSVHDRFEPVQITDSPHDGLAPADPHRH